jgi:acyl-CoA dehydrogenase
LDFALTPEQADIREQVLRLCAAFGDEYWLRKDREGAFPEEFHAAMAKGGWLGIAMPQDTAAAASGSPMRP